MELISLTVKKIQKPSKVHTTYHYLATCPHNAHLQPKPLFSQCIITFDTDLKIWP